jgi:hypothetical protein
MNYQNNTFNYRYQLLRRHVSYLNVKNKHFYVKYQKESWSLKKFTICTLLRAHSNFIFND